MNRIVLAGVLLALGALVAAPVLARPPYGAPAYGYPEPAEPYYDGGSYFDYARVLDVDPILVHDRYRGSSCYPPPRYRQPYSRASRENVGGTILGAVIGGALGNLAGKGDGRKAATIAGVVIGGAIGHGNDARHARGGRYAYDDGYDDYGAYDARRCDRGIDRTRERIVGYDVTYRYDGRIYRTRLNHNPGPELRVAVNDSVVPAE